MEILNEAVLKALPDQLWQVILILLAPTGVFITIAKLWFKIPLTKAAADKQKNDAAMVLLEGWERTVKDLRQQNEDQRRYYEERIKFLEKKIDDKEAEYKAELKTKDGEISQLRREVNALTRKLARYEGMKDRADQAEEKIQETVKTEIAHIKEPTDEKE